MELNIENKKVENNLDKNLNNKIENEIDNNVTEERQNDFIQTSLAKTINSAIDVGLRNILPDVIEDQIIEIKNAIMNNGFKEGIESAIKSAIDLAKSTLGIFSGKFENLSQVHSAIKKGGIVDSISSLLDNIIKKANAKNQLSNDTAKIISKGKNIILDFVSNKIEDNFLTEIKSFDKFGQSIEEWKNCFNNNDVKGMKKEFNKIKKEIKKITPLQKIINEVKKIENVHTLLKNKGDNYELSEIEKELANKLIY